MQFVILDRFGNLFGPFGLAATGARFAKEQWPDDESWRCEPMRSTDYEPPLLALSTADTTKGRPMGLTFKTFSEANRNRCESPFGFKHPLSGWSTSDWMTAMVGEVGEAANVVKKLNRYRDGVPGNKASADELRTQLRKELGDVFVYLDLMAQSLGFSIEDAAVEVFNAKSAEIGYGERLDGERLG